MTPIEQVVYNLSAYRYQYISIYENALSQLDHIFSVSGNGYDYRDDLGIFTHNYDTNKVERLNQPIAFDFAMIKAKHDASLAKQQANLDEMIAIFGDVQIPDNIRKIYDVSDSIYAQEFKVQSEQYYFNHEVVAKQYIEYIEKENARIIHRVRKYVGSPYPLSENYSLINFIKSDDDPVFVRLALSTYKAWLIVLDWLILNGVYLARQEVEKYGGESYCDSLEYLQQSIVNFESIIKVLENNHE